MMNRLDKFIYESKEYMFLGRLKLDSKEIYVSKELHGNGKKFFINNSQGVFEEIKDEVFIKRIYDYITPKSLDVVYGEY